MNQPLESRRNFLLSTAAGVTSAWLASNWPGIAAAADHAAHVAATSTSAPVAFGFLSPTEAADVDAIAAQILPSGATPGAREAHAVYFIDRAFTTFFADRAPPFRAGLTDFQRAFHTAQPAVGAFASASPADQLAYLKIVDRTPFFESMRMLTILGTLSASKYGGNFEGIGWKIIGFEDQHVFEPPFGYYDREYTGFVPYTKEAAS
jgi:gluconate 2-dehydrogenase gamma chain